MEEIKILIAPYDTVPDSIKVQGCVSDNPFDYVRIYADGELDNRLSNDIMAILLGAADAKKACVDNATVPVKVVGIDQPCSLYAWSTTFCNEPRMIAFAVLDSDTRAVERAKKKQAERAKFA